MIKKSLDKKIEEIIHALPADEFIELADEFSLLADAIAALKIPLSHTKECASEVVFHLSSFADKYGKLLHDFSKKYPKLYLEIDQMREDNYTASQWDETKDEFDDETT